MLGRTCLRLQVSRVEKFWSSTVKPCWKRKHLTERSKMLPISLNFKRLLPIKGLKVTDVMANLLAHYLLTLFQDAPWWSIKINWIKWREESRTWFYKLVSKQNATKWWNTGTMSFDKKTSAEWVQMKKIYKANKLSGSAHYWKEWTPLILTPACFSGDYWVGLRRPKAK